MAWKNKPIFNRDDIREPYTDVFLKNAAGKTRKSTKGRFSRGDKETIYTAHEKGALPRDVIKISALAGGAGRRERWFYCKDCLMTCFPEEAKEHKECNIIKHPTQKPTALTEKLLLSCKPKDDGLVVVPFVGSGSEVMVARGLDMDFIGFEIFEDYVEMANSLIKRQEMLSLILGNLVEQVVQTKEKGK
jgi:site-specific DNA-methyltransferase (adenine-specific)